jgi:hypothetical protein
VKEELPNAQLVDLADGLIQKKYQVGALAWSIVVVLVKNNYA